MAACVPVRAIKYLVRQQMIELGLQFDAYWFYYRMVGGCGRFRYQPQRMQELLRTLESEDPQFKYEYGLNVETQQMQYAVWMSPSMQVCFVVWLRFVLC